MVIRPICRCANGVVASGLATLVVTWVGAAGRVGCIGLVERSDVVDEQPATKTAIAPMAPMPRFIAGVRPQVTKTPPTASNGT
jgi:hypothetical protein